MLASSTAGRVGAPSSTATRWPRNDGAWARRHPAPSVAPFAVSLLDRCRRHGKMAPTRQNNARDCPAACKLGYVAFNCCELTAANCLAHESCILAPQSAACNQHECGNAPSRSSSQTSTPSRELAGLGEGCLAAAQRVLARHDPRGGWGRNRRRACAPGEQALTIKIHMPYVRDRRDSGARWAGST